METPTPQYCTPEEVAASMDLPELGDIYSSMAFNENSHPSYDQVCRMIAANEDEIDRRVRRTWKENYVIAQQLSIQDYWADTNGWRSDYYQYGGHYIQLRKDIRPWDPNPIYDDKEHITYVESTTGLNEGDIIEVDKKNGQIYSISTTPTTVDGKSMYEVGYHLEIYPGDKLEIRNRNNVWQDISGSIQNNSETGSDVNSGPSRDVTNSYIDYAYGKIYIRSRLYQNKGNAIRVTYRYGKDPESVPAGINRVCCLMTAIDIMVMSPFYIKVGQSGDINGAYDRLIKGWQDVINKQLSSWQRSGSVHAMW